MTPIFVFIALPTLSLALVIAILCRRLSTPGFRSHGTIVRRAMSRLEALQMLGLDDDAGRDDIRSAYMRLMIRYHPDHGGSHQTASQLNLARDVLLGKKRKRAA
jgi:preprotein translocase subunit Sec63